MSPARPRAEACRYLVRGTSTSVGSVTLEKLSVADGIARFFRRTWLRWRHFFCCLGHFIDHTFEIIQARDGNDDRVAFSSRILRDAQKPAPRIFLERDGENLALDLKFGGLDGVLLDEGPWRVLVARCLIGPPTVGRWTFV